MAGTPAMDPGLRCIAALGNVSGQHMISVVIPTYNRKECLLNLLGCLGNQSVTAEVIVVDDCSTDDTAAAVAASFPQVTLLRNEVNRGPAASRNRGILHARGEFIVGFDSDVTIVDAQLLEKVARKFAASPDIAGLAFRLFKSDGTTEDSARWWHPLPIVSYATQPFLTDYFSGTGYAFRKQSMEAAGLFPEILYMHYEEVELAFRILDNGESILYCPDLTALHHANEVSRRSEIRVFYKPRNQVLVTLRCYPVLRGLYYLLPRVIYGLMTAIAGGHVNRFWAAMRSAANLTSQCIQDRRSLKKTTWRKISSMRSYGGPDH